MQVVRSVPVSAGEYVSQAFHETIERPGTCLLCRAEKRFEALGYYQRGITLGRRVVTIFVRRFRCLECGRTASVLPSFAQPYRLVQNAVIHEYFETETVAPSSPWKVILRNYWKRFRRWLPELRKALTSDPEKPPPFDTGPQAWSWLQKAVGKLEAITDFLIAEFQITPFGRYRCHQRAA